MDAQQILGFFEEDTQNPDTENQWNKNILNLRMQNDDMGNLLQRNKRRRSKKDKQGRVFECGCGKKYLSYPALYTHIKNKHDGHSPEGTTKQPMKRPKPSRRHDGDNDRENSKMSGDPSSYGDRSSDSEDNSQRDDSESNLSTSNLNDNSVFKSAKSKKKVVQNKLTLLSEKLVPPKTLAGLFADIPHQLKSYILREQLQEFQQPGKITNFNLSNQQKKNDILFNQKLTETVSDSDLNRTKLQDAPVNPNTGFPKYLNQITGSFFPHHFIKYFQSLEQNSLTSSTQTPVSSELPMYTINLYFQNNGKSCDSFFSLFLFKLATFSNSVVYSFISSVFRSLRDCLNEFGYDILERFVQQNEGNVKVELQLGGDDNQNDRGSFCEVEEPQFISVIFDFFLKEYYEKWVNRGNQGTQNTDKFEAFSNALITDTGHLEGQMNLEIVAKILHWFNHWLVDSGFSKIALDFDGFDMPIYQLTN